MNERVRIILFAIAAISLGSCQPNEDLNTKTMLSVSIQPQKYFIEKLAGELVDVNVLIPPGASPATYEPSLAQLSKLSRSELYMRIGYVGFELSWMEKISSVNPHMKIVDLSRGIDLIHEEEEDPGDHHDHSHGGIDPHIWMSVINAKIIARNVYNELIQLFPAEEEKMKNKLSEFNDELDTLQDSVAKHMKDLEQRNFLIYHPALSYFARDYDLHQYPIEIEGKTPSPAHLKRLTDLSQEKNISAIFVQSQFDIRNAEVLADEIDAEIVQFNPLDEEWKKQMLYIVERFKQP